MNRMTRPADAAPGGMGGVTRMRDPSEALHDRVRRGLMNGAFVLVALLITLQLKFTGVHGLDWLRVLLLAVAAAPLAMGVKVFELRFKLADEERRRMLGELPAKTTAGFIVYVLLAAVVFACNVPRLPWALLGLWCYDFVSYYHDRPERIRHLYAAAKILDELRWFRAPWVWTLPSLAFEVIKRVLAR
jgi:hypothetical protein